MSAAKAPAEARGRRPPSRRGTRGSASTAGVDGADAPRAGRGDRTRGPAGLGDAVRGTVLRPLRARLRGDRVARHVPSFLRFLSLPAREMRAEETRRLRALLVHARDTVPLHRERMRAAGFVPEDLRSPDDLARCPTLSRWDVFERSQDLLSAPFRRRSLVRARSGGTTAAAVAFFQTPEAVAEKEAATRVLRARMGWHAGAREAFLWGARQDLPPAARGALARARQSVRARVLEGRSWFPADDLSPDRLGRAAASLAAFRPDVLQAYPSAADLLARHVAERGPRLRIPLVVLTAEPVPEAVRERVSEALSARVLTFYGARECGWIASEQASCGRLHVNTAAVRLESVDGRLLVTDLVNRAMPLVRYEIGDRGALDPAPCACGDPRPVLSSLEGRENDVLSLPSGRRIPGSLLDVRGRQLDAPGIMEARFVQTGPAAVSIEWVPGPNFRRADERAFAERVRALLHHEMAVDLVRVDRLRAEPNGKVRVCVALPAEAPAGAGAGADARAETSAALPAEARPDGSAVVGSPAADAARPARRAEDEDRWVALAGRVLQPLGARLRREGWPGRTRACEAFLALPPAAMRAAARARLRDLVTHAAATVPAYARRFAAAGVDPVRAGPDAALLAIAPVTRADLARDPDSFRSSAHRRGGLVATHTGGTTGRPMPFLQTPASIAEKDAAARVLRRRMGIVAGSRRAYLWGAAQDAPAASRGRLRRLAHAAIARGLHRELYLPATGLDDALLDDYAERLRRFRPSFLQGYPSATDLLARRLLARGDAVAVPTVLLTAEPVLEGQRERIARAFGGRVLAFYGARECGWIASECPEERRLHVNTMGVHVEATADGRLLVTDLVNRAMPLLRYEVGDRGGLDPDPCRCGDPRPVLAALEGRVTDVFVLPSGRRVPGVVADLRGYRAGEGILDVQLVQDEPSAVDVHWVPTARFRPEDLDALRERLDRWFFGEVRLRFHRAERIAPGPNGKVRWCVCRVPAP